MDSGRGRQDKRDARHERCRTGRIQAGGIHESRDSGLEGFGKEGIQKKREGGNEGSGGIQEGFKTGGITGMKGCRKVVMQERRDAGK